MQSHSYGSAITINGDIYTEVSVIITLDGCVWGNASMGASGWRLWTQLCSVELSALACPTNMDHVVLNNETADVTRSMNFCWWYLNER